MVQKFLTLFKLGYPNFWRRDNTLIEKFITFLLLPFTSIYFFVSKISIKKVGRVGVPVVCVGNLNTGGSGNWVWWAFLLTGMLTVFVYANLWRRSGVATDIEFYELRYSGKAAAFLRGFRALYLGLVFNILVIGAVSLGAVKFG